MRTLASYSDPISKAKTKTLRQLIENDPRIVGFSIEDRVFIYTNSSEWDNGDGSGTFTGDTETEAVKVYKATVQKNDEGRI